MYTTIRKGINLLLPCSIPDPELAHRVSQLTRRETDVLSGVMEKKGDKEIAAELGIRETTVKRLST